MWLDYFRSNFHAVPYISLILLQLMSESPVQWFKKAQEREDDNLSGFCVSGMFRIM